MNIFEAAEEGHLHVVEDLIENVDPSMHDNLAIILASQNGHINIVVRLLQDPRVDPSASDNDAIIVASRNGHIEIVKRLLEDPRVDPSANNNRAIQKATRNNHIEVVNILIDDPRVNPKPRRKDLNFNKSMYRVFEDPRVYNDEGMKIYYKEELDLMKEMTMMRKQVIDAAGIPEDLIYELCKYLHYDTEYYRTYL